MISEQEYQILRFNYTFVLTVVQSAVGPLEFSRNLFIHGDEYDRTGVEMNDTRGVLFKLSKNSWKKIIGSSKAKFQEILKLFVTLIYEVSSSISLPSMFLRMLDDAFKLRNTKIGSDNQSDKRLKPNRVF